MGQKEVLILLLCSYFSIRHLLSKGGTSSTMYYCENIPVLQNRTKKIKALSHLKKYRGFAPGLFWKIARKLVAILFLSNESL